MVPGVLMLFMLLITVYSIGTELKFGRSKEWMQMAGKNIVVALSGKLLPQFLVSSPVLGLRMVCHGHLNFPHPGGISKMLLLALLTVSAAQGFGVFVFGLMPSLRMSMSVCSLWAVVGVLGVRSNLSFVRHGFANHRFSPAHTPPTLLYGVPNDHLQRLSAHKCVAARGGTCGICSPSIAYGAQHSPCYAGVCVYTLKQLLGRG